MDEELKEIKKELKDLNKKLDAYHEQTVANKTDIAWLKRGMFGTFFSGGIFTAIGAAWYSKFGG